MFKNTLIALCLFGIAASAIADEKFPSDVAKFVAKREDCDHMRGEIPESADKRQMKEIIREINAQCKGTDRNLAKLKKKYSGNAEVMRRLEEFEPRIEAK
jgi:hypothetical protein